MWDLYMLKIFDEIKSALVLKHSSYAEPANNLSRLKFCINIIYEFAFSNCKSFDETYSLENF